MSIVRNHKKLHQIWGSMKSRCNNRNHTDYPRYGGRGIMVDESFNLFKDFVKWSLENGYEEGLSIDRINNESGYSPSNCRWVTSREQSRNRSNSVLITIGGVTKNLCDWIEESPVNDKTIKARIYLFGWDYERALTEPPRRYRRSNYD